MVLLLCVLFAVCSSEIVSISPENASLLNDGKAWFVFFSLPTCPHCKALVPAWKDLAESLEGSIEVGVAQVDCGAHKGTALCEGITSFPTLVWRSSDGATKSYHGARGGAALRLFVAKQAGPAVRHGAEWLQRDVNGTVVVRSDRCEGSVAEAFAAAALQLRDRFFFVVVPGSAGVECSVEVVRMGGQERAAWSLEGNLTAFVEREATPLVSPFQKFVHATSKLLVVYLFHEEDAAASDVLHEFRSASRTLRDSNSKFVANGKKIVELMCSVIS